jgi:hypothetical protein
MASDIEARRAAAAAGLKLIKHGKEPKRYREGWGAYTLIDPKTGMIIESGAYAEQVVGLCARPDPTVPVSHPSIISRVRITRAKEAARRAR